MLPSVCFDPNSADASTFLDTASLTALGVTKPVVLGL